MRTTTVLSVIAFAVLSFSADAQYVVSAQSGLLNYFEGSVYLNSVELPQVRGRFQQLSQGAVLSTKMGKAEVLLTPNAFIWVDQNSAIRLVSTDLTNTVVEVLKGSAMVGAGESTLDDDLTVLYRNRTIRVPHQGFYRIDCDPFLVRVSRGAVELSGFGDPVLVNTGNILNASLAPDPFAGKCRDDFDVWTVKRAKSLRLFSRSRNHALMTASHGRNAHIFPRTHAEALKASGAALGR